MQRRNTLVIRATNDNGPGYKRLQLMFDQLCMRGLLDGLITRFSCSFTATGLYDLPVSRIRRMLIIRGDLPLDLALQT